MRSSAPATIDARGAHGRLSLSIQCGDGVALPASRAQLRRWVSAAVDGEPGLQLQLTLRFVGTREARRLNAEFRRRDYATNVLTFVYAEPPQGAADVVICMPVLRREARAQRKTLAAHLAHLVVHGVLHACGHDHTDEADALRMESREAQILARFRIADPYRRSAR